MRLETKDLPLAATGLQVKDGGDDAPVTLVGYGSTFGGDPDSFGDVIAPGAYAKSLTEWSSRGFPLPILWNHDPKLPIGKWIELAEDGTGLKVRGELTPGHSLAKDVAASLRHSAVSGLSIGYRTRKASDGPKGVRVLEDIELHEVSVVTNPANTSARVTGLKSADELTLRDLETLIREQYGFSRRETEAALRAALKSYAALARDEQDERQDHKATSERRDDGIKASPLLATLRELRLTPA